MSEKKALTILYDEVAQHIGDITKICHPDDEKSSDDMYDAMMGILYWRIQEVYTPDTTGK